MENMNRRWQEVLGFGRRFLAVGRRSAQNLLPGNMKPGSGLHVWQEVAGGFSYLRVWKIAISRVYAHIYRVGSKNLLQPPAAAPVSSLCDGITAPCAGRRSARSTVKPPANLLLFGGNLLPRFRTAGAAAAGNDKCPPPRDSAVVVSNGVSPSLAQVILSLVPFEAGQCACITLANLEVGHVETSAPDHGFDHPIGLRGDGDDQQYCLRHHCRSHPQRPLQQAVRTDSGWPQERTISVGVAPCHLAEADRSSPAILGSSGASRVQLLGCQPKEKS